MLPPGSCSSEMPLPLRYSCARLGRQAPSCATSAQRTPLWFSTSTDSGRLAARPGAGCSRLAVRFRAVSLGSAREMASTSAQLDSRLPLRSSSSSSGARAARAAGSPALDTTPPRRLATRRRLSAVSTASLSAPTSSTATVRCDAVITTISASASPSPSALPSPPAYRPRSAAAKGTPRASFSTRTRLPPPGAHLKYDFPPTVPSCLPASSCTHISSRRA
mmetsp:Transcript_33008/g.85596  ORF Transcript_33008/g.85596 Transcript_33008/m.85596 type:complete len:220 (+) Transcript_33008:2-661(+)